MAKKTSKKKKSKKSKKPKSTKRAKVKVKKKKKKASPKKTKKKAAPKKKTSAKTKRKTSKKSANAKPAPPPQVDGTLLGRVEDFFAHIGVVALTLAAPLAIGDTIRIKGHTTDLTEPVLSMQIEHQPVESAQKGDGVGIKINGRARHTDWVFRI